MGQCCEADTQHCCHCDSSVGCLQHDPEVLNLLFVYVCIFLTGGWKSSQQCRSIDVTDQDQQRHPMKNPPSKLQVFQAFLGLHSAPRPFRGNQKTLAGRGGRSNLAFTGLRCLLPPQRRLQPIARLHGDSVSFNGRRPCRCEFARSSVCGHVEAAWCRTCGEARFGQSEDV